ncbi:MAG: AMP-forming long-chain acyl-CoA [Bacteroidetes bacterium]|nr:MAG: AMP-forming long-chain acyl-CoA [Bacteroidota bacterium]
MRNLIDLLDVAVEKFPDNTYLHEKRGSEWHQRTYTQTREKVHAFGAGLLKLGVEYGDRIALLSEGRDSWIISELGLLCTGCCSVPLSVKLTPAEISFRIKHSGAKVAIVSENQLYKIKEIQQELTELEHIILLDKTSVKQSGDYYFEDICEEGAAIMKSNPDVLRETINKLQPETIANITYTSGTTADPKGVMISHGNYISNVEQSLTLMEIPDNYRTLAILPWDHCFAHTACLYCFIAKGASVASVQAGKTANETLKNIPINIKEIKPNLLMSVPALSKNFRKNIESGIAKKGKIAVTLFNAGIKVAYAYNGIGINQGKGFRALLKPLVLLFDKILFSKIREGFGGELKFFIGGGALLDAELQRFFLAIGIPVCQGYGLSEASPVISSNSVKNLKIGTSGKLVKPLELKICDPDGNELPKGQSGEIVIKGGNVMMGYWKNPESTAETIKNGWLYTGDLGYMDNDDYLVVKGRFKSLLIGSDGEKFSPEGIEEALIDNSALIDQCMLHNNQDPYTVGLIVPNTAELKRLIKKQGFEPSTEDGLEAGISIIAHEIESYFGKGKHSGIFPERWLPACFVILPEAFTEKNHMVNSTLKMVRGKINESYISTFAFLYTPAAKNPVNAVNKDNLRKLFSTTE